MLQIQSRVARMLALVTKPHNVNKLTHNKFETTLTEYIGDLILCSVLAGITNAVVSVTKSLYLDIFLNADVAYLRSINYAMSTSTSIMFTFLFFGSLIVFVISLLLRPIAKGLKYTLQLQLLMVSLTPVLLFGWILYLIPGLLVWSAVLYINGIKSLRTSQKSLKGSINQRE